MTIAEQLEARGEARGKTEGRTEGRTEALKITALNLLKEGAEPQFVARVTGLSLEQVKQLRTEATGQ